MNPQPSRQGKKRRKKLPSTGFELRTFCSTSQNYPTEPRGLRYQKQNCKNKKHLIRSVHCWFLLRFLVPKIFVFANFSQVPPISANFGLYSTNLDLIQQLFHLYDMGGQGWTLFQNQPFGLYLGDPWSNFENFCWCILHFVPYFSHWYRFACTFAQSLGNFYQWAKSGFYAKIVRQFWIFHIDSHS